MKTMDMINPLPMMLPFHTMMMFLVNIFLIKTKELSFCHKLKFCNPYIFVLFPVASNPIRIQSRVIDYDSEPIEIASAVTSVYLSI